MNPIISTVPPTPNNIPADPAFFTPVKTVTFDPTGRIIGYSDTALAYVRQRQLAGERVALGSGAEATQYVRLDGEAPEVWDRPTITGALVPETVAVGEEAVLDEVPAGLIRFTGPISGEHDHPGGRLEIGFTVPGTYQIEIEPFPYRLATFTLTVTP